MLDIELIALVIFVLSWDRSVIVIDCHRQYSLQANDWTVLLYYLVMLLRNSCHPEKRPNHLSINN